MSDVESANTNNSVNEENNQVCPLNITIFNIFHKTA